MSPRLREEEESKERSLLAARGPWRQLDQTRNPGSGKVDCRFAFDTAKVVVPTIYYVYFFDFLPVGIWLTAKAVVVVVSVLTFFGPVLSTT